MIFFYIRLAVHYCHLFKNRNFLYVTWYKMRLFQELSDLKEVKTIIVVVERQPLNT